LRQQNLNTNVSKMLQTMGRQQKSHSCWGVNGPPKDGSFTSLPIGVLALESDR
jgi:hypothetical protein